MMFRDVVRRKRDGFALTDREIEYFVAGLSDGSLPGDQIAALAMAIYWRSLDPTETGMLTRAMARSGRVMDWSGAVDGPVLDKHSTGGVGDKVSLVLAPIVAACGGHVPMISGAGLDHTGGTLDKLSSVPGYDIFADHATFRSVVRDVGCAIIGQTGELAPADRRLYAVRDVTATVESLPLICASILSKKLAAGVAGLVMDVKYGSGAFMRKSEDARALGQALIEVGREAGLPVTAVVTDMNQVLGTTAGNAVEVRESIAYLAGTKRDPRLHAVTIELSAEMLVMGGLATTVEDARRRVEAALSSGAALERFARMVSALGGPADLVEQSERHLPLASVRRDVFPETRGEVAAIDVRAIGMAVIGLGAGRTRLDDIVDGGVGIVDMAGVGDEVGQHRPICSVLARSEDAAIAAAAAIRVACRIGGEIRHFPLIQSRLPDRDEQASSYPLATAGVA